MALRIMSVGQDRVRLHREWMERSEKAFQEMFGEDQQKNLVTFSEREERAVDIGRALSRLLIEEHIAADPAAQPSVHAGDTAPGDTPSGTCGCPRCGKAGVLVTKAEDPLPGRKVESLAGAVGLEREQYACATCRVVFFPLGPEIGAGDGGLQPGGVAQDGASREQDLQFRRGQPRLE